MCRVIDESPDQMQARILGRKRSTGRSNFEVGSEVEGMQERQTEGRRESVRIWETGQMLIFEEEIRREESPLGQH